MADIVKVSGCVLFAFVILMQTWTKMDRVDWMRKNRLILDDDDANKEEKRTSKSTHTWENGYI